MKFNSERIEFMYRIPIIWTMKREKKKKRKGKNKTKTCACRCT